MVQRTGTWILALGLIAVFAPSCGSGGSSDPDATATDAAATDGAAPSDAQPPGSADSGPPAAGCTPTDSEDFALELVAQGLDGPLFVTSPNGDDRLFVVTQAGGIWIVEDGERLDDRFLDLTPDVSSGFEQGLLGLAFHPDYADNGRFFVNYTNTAGDTIVAEYSVSSDPNIAEQESAQVILEVDQPAANHNGGTIEFGPDGYLYIGMGDGGGSGGNDLYDNAQDLTTLNGAMLRIDVDAQNEPYVIPPDNPYVEDAGARDEIWAHGLRNPWRWSFDNADGLLYIADVGQSAWEEVNATPVGTAGVNYAWPCYEGSAEHDPRGNCSDIGTPDFTLPVHEYENENSACSVTGGYVYRGECLEALEGRYLFGDYCSGQIWSFSLQDGEATDVQELTDDLDPEGAIQDLSSFGEDAYGELYITSLGTGEVFRIVSGGEE